MLTTKLTQPKSHFQIQYKKSLIKSINVYVNNHIIKLHKNNRLEQPSLKLFLKKGVVKIISYLCLKKLVK